MMALQSFPQPITSVFLDKQSAFERSAHQKLMKKLGEDDLLVIHDIDRPGRNYDEILEQWRLITKEKGADIAVLNFPLLDTCGQYGNDLTGRFVRAE